MRKKEKIQRLHDYCECVECSNCLVRDKLQEDYNGYCPHFYELSDQTLDEVLSIINAEDCKEDPVNRPSHYTDGKIEVIDFIEDKKLGFCLGNAVKYIARAGKKDPAKEVEDLKKAEWYVKRRIKELEEVNSNE